MVSYWRRTVFPTENIALICPMQRVIEERTEELNSTVSTKVRYAYDAAGNRSEVTKFDENGAHTTQTFYNPQGKPIREIDPLGNETVTE